MFNGNNAGDSRPGDSEIMDDELQANVNKMRIDSKNDNRANEIKNNVGAKGMLEHFDDGPVNAELLKAPKEQKNFLAKANVIALHSKSF